MKKVCILAILAACFVGCTEDSKDNDPSKELNCEATNQVACNGACYDACEGGAARDSECKCPGAPVDKTCEEQGKVTCNGTCYDPCPDGNSRDSQCNCPEKPTDKSCEELNKIECNGACYAPCADGSDLDENCKCPGEPAELNCEEQNKVECNGACYDPCEGGADLDENCKCPGEPAELNCEEQNKVECNGACYDPCEGGADLDENCKCPGEPVELNCEEQNKVECNGACYDPCEGGADLDENCKCPGAPADKKCEDQGKVTCNGACYDPCENGADLDENCKCPEKPVTPKTCEKDADCNEDAPYCVKGVCKADKPEAAVCGNGIVEEGEKCDFGKNDKGNLKEESTCDKYAPQYSSGNVTCKNNCKDLDVSKCASGEHEGLYYCQLMTPVKVVFGPDLSEATMNGRVAVAGVTDKTTGNDGVIEAELVYGSDLKAMTSWKSMAATADSSFTDSAVDAYTAKLTEAQFKAVDSDTVYYTFRFREKKADEWKYCQSNNEDPNQVKGGIDFVEITSTGSKANVHEIGIATSTKISQSNILARFTFDSHSDSEKDANAKHSAEEGTAFIQGKSIHCDSNGCFANDDRDGMAWNISNWKKSKADAVKDGAHILITDLNATGTKDIGLDMRISRNNSSNSPTNIVVLYSLDGEKYEEARDIDLEIEKIKVFFDYATILPSAVNGQSKLSIKLVPYGGNGLIRLDNITISKNHPE